MQRWGLRAALNLESKASLSQWWPARLIRYTGALSELEQHAGQRAAGDAAQRGPQDCGNRRAGRLTSQARAEMAVQVHATIGSHRPSPVRRVYIPKASDKTKMRPLGIPVLSDRCHQARVRNALEPEWEARFEPRSYGFRPGRGCHDAIESLYNTLCGKSRRVWILDADLAGAFRQDSHGHLLGMLGGFPREGYDRRMAEGRDFRGWERFAPTGEGTPQGSLCAAAHKPPCGVPLSVSLNSQSSRYPARSMPRMSRRNRWSSIFSASIRIRIS